MIEKKGAHLKTFIFNYPIIRIIVLVCFLQLANINSYAQDSIKTNVSHVSSKKFTSFIRDLLKTNPDLIGHFQYIFNVEDLRYHKKNIPSNLAIINYILLEKELLIFCATRDSVFAKRIETDGKNLRKEIFKMYELVRFPGFIPSSGRGSRIINRKFLMDEEKELNMVSNNLYTILIGSLLTEISSKKVLNIIPNADLRIIPFCALISKISKNGNRYLFNDFILINSSNSNLSNQSEKIKFEEIKILAVGNPDKSLPFAEQEVEWIKKRFPSSLVYTQERATKNNIISHLVGYNFNILHFATHGYFNYQNYDSSYILIAEDSLSGTSKYFNLLEELLTSGEYFSLLFISACESGVSFDEKAAKNFINGNSFKQDNNFGSAGSFLRGSSAIIATLWQIDDKSTSRLIEYFYNNLESSNIPESLNMAQESLKSIPEYRHPYYWAPFMYFGRM